jgi:phenylalanyl-tRNA synthetase alpha chain
MQLDIQFSANQIQRLKEIGCDFDEGLAFASAAEREAAFKTMERACIEKSRSSLNDYRNEGKAPAVNELGERISAFLRALGFIEVNTPLIITKKFLENMTIGDDHALNDQVFWLDGKSCLRPMLAPNLYDISKRMLKVYGQPLGVFEIGPCFRKESLGGRHLECFTMINFVEWGIEESIKIDRFKELAILLLDHLGLEGYSFEEEESVVYGNTIDVVVGDVEVASGAFGPHPLDKKWDMDTTWLGLGIGLERIVMLKEGLDTIQKAGRSLRYLGGVSLNFK